jgi:RHH-type rel operon transcriptional repressor/antitoxin RelB
MPYSLRLPHEIEERLEKLAAMTGRTKAFYIMEAIFEHLDDMEDVYIAEKRLEDIKLGRTKTLPLKEVMKEYDLEN